MKCPICVDSTLTMADRQGIEIDYCPECRGVWLDRGELDKIIERSSAPVTPQAPRYDERGSDRHSQGSRDHDYYKKKKKGGLLGELFDF